MKTNPIDALIVDAARRYIGAERIVAASGKGDMVLSMIERDAAFHELAVLVLGVCPYCDEGTCPNERPVIDTEPL